MVCSTIPFFKVLSSDLMKNYKQQQNIFIASPFIFQLFCRGGVCSSACVSSSASASCPSKPARTTRSGAGTSSFIAYVSHVDAGSTGVRAQGENRAEHAAFRGLWDDCGKKWQKRSLKWQKNGSAQSPAWSLNASRNWNAESLH